MYESQDIPKTAGAVAGWQAFAADGKARMDRELALSAKCDLLFPLRSLYNAPQPIAIYFYGPGPDGRLHPEGPPVGTLHFARWRHEFAAFVDPDGLGYYHEDNPMTINGQQIRPTYTTKGNQVAREVNYFRWERVPAQFLAGVKTYPGPGATRAIHDEYLLNHDDFNDHDVERRKVRADLDNRLDEDPKTIYPLGYRLLKKWSQVNGHPQWQEGVCLGADPGNSDALTKHIGWFPKRLRRTKAGLGADPQDAVWKEVFHGNVDAKAKEIFTPPKDRWSDDPSKVTTMTCSKSSHMAQDHDSVLTFDIVSLSALKEILSLPEPDTLDARNTWLDGRAPIRRLGYRAKEDLKPSGLGREVGHPGQCIRRAPSC
ncbi:hypothetical protein F5B22DRAFT_609197 [Xylaria bambusicola]|uniref:uncharacterized protein n=1 Tax=Xylaria bambusicola TaxID=326684 RepID=UPI0020085C48|nr:uncharacterized protein F5B22DRAFT_609197 [Xylaria bambusicola]KAI0514965.1 hypothetical protein F5B22DRAFT_609197 [Xylaria bambusicola]